MYVFVSTVAILTDTTRGFSAVILEINFIYDHINHLTLSAEAGKELGYWIQTIPLQIKFLIHYSSIILHPTAPKNCHLI